MASATRWPRPWLPPASSPSASRLFLPRPWIWLSPSWLSCCSCVVPLFLAKLALRVEVADAAALTAGRRVDHRVDESGLAGVHGGIDGAPQFVGRRRVDAGAAERLHHLVVTRAFDEHGGRRIVT